MNIDRKKLGKRSRNEGNNWELDILKWLKNLFPDAVTSRNESRTRDAQKVDFCNTRMWNFQAKSTCTGVNYHKLLNEMPVGELNVIIHKRTEKAGTKFMDKGHYVIMDEDTFQILLTNHECMMEGNHTKVKLNLNR